MLLQALTSKHADAFGQGTTKGEGRGGGGSSRGLTHRQVARSQDRLAKSPEARIAYPHDHPSPNAHGQDRPSSRSPKPGLPTATTHRKDETNDTPRDARTTTHARHTPEKCQTRQTHRETLETRHTPETCQRHAGNTPDIHAPPKKAQVQRGASQQAVLQKWKPHCLQIRPDRSAKQTKASQKKCQKVILEAKKFF